jgi:Domain of unknown function (DUF4136)
VKKSALIVLPLAAMLALSACSNNTYAEVVRFHTNQPMNRGTIAIVPADPSVGNTLEFRTHGETVAIELRRLGFTTGLPADQTQYTAVVDITQTDGTGAVTRPGATVGVSGNVVGVAAPVGRRPNVVTNRSTTLSVQIKRNSDGVMIWEGRASKEAETGTQGATATAAVPALAGALFGDFPGTPGVTTNVRL